MSYRDLNSTLQTSLINNDVHRYLHLIKFEKPSTKTELDYKEGSKVSQKANTYAYMSDGAFEVDFNDGSIDVDGNANGTQTYLPNKVLSVGTVNETIEAKASTMNLSLAASALSAAVSTSFTFTSSTITALVDLEQSGFSVGDTIEFSASGQSNDGVYVRIDGFSNDNKTISYTVIDGNVTNQNSTVYTASYASSEVDSLTLSKTSTNYSNYLNREVFIYRAHLNPTTGSIIGSPFLIFKGIITNANLQDDPTKGSKINWSLTSHWGDFVQVVGRITSDHAHRGLDTSGVSQEDAVFRPEYAGDFGFRHAEQAVNVAATYQVPETRFKQKRRGGIAGLFGGKRLVEYTVMVDRDVDLEFNLSAKYIPVVYGVQKVSGIPIFADGDSGDPQKVYIAQAISEGPIHGILDLHIDNNPVICINGPDNLDRSSGDAQVQCVGRADRGDVLAGGSSVNAAGSFHEQVAQLAQELLDSRDADDYNEALMIAYQMLAYSEVDETATGGAGITDRKKFNLDSPLSTEIQFHAGTPTQEANSFFVAKGLAGGFKLQSILYRDKPREYYWSPEHRLLDTAYSTMQFTIADGEFTIPDYEFIVKGRILECFNYDYSYSGSGTASNFKLGENVTLHKTTDDSQLGSTTVQIIDKWSFYGPTGTLKYRFRFDKNYQLQSVRGDSNGDVKNFYMKDASNNKFFFSAYDAVIEDINEDPIENNSFQSQTSITSLSHPNVDFGAFTRTIWVVEEPAPGEYEAEQIEVTDYRLENLPTGLAEFNLGEVLAFELTDSEGQTEIVQMAYDSYSSGQITFPEVHANSTNSTLALRNKFNRATSWKLFSADTVKLDTNSSAVDDTYNGQKLIIREKTSSGSVRQTTTRVINDYVGSTKLAKLSQALTINPDSSSVFDYTIEGDINIDESDMFAAFEDKRVSINPAIQLLDYLTNKRYGKGLDLENDIDLESFLTTARACDERSKITIITSTNPGSIQGNTYRYPATGDLLFQGVVDENPTSFTAPDGNTYYSVTFRDVIGKLIYKWSDARTFYPGEVLYHEGTAFTTTLTSPSTINSSQRDNLITSNALNDTTNRFTLRDVSNSADMHIFVDSSDNFGSSSGNPVIRKNSGSGMTAVGYSLYDSDDCKYWVYLGWDEPEQRYVTRHQTNFTVDTSQSVFNNINGMLSTFNGMLRYSNGKYVLALKTAAPEATHFTSTFPAKDIAEDEIIGQVKVSDSGSKKTFNSINATIIDPANKFGGRGITFMNSEYLKQDRGIKKQGNYNIPGITNYFNARMNIKQVLDESRYGLTINFTLDQKGYLLLAGDIIRLSYSRFGWENKFFRINSLNFQANGLVQVVAEEHNDTAFIIDHLETGRTGGTLEGGNQGSIPTSKPTIPTSVASPLTATTTDRSGYIELKWVNGRNFNNQAHRTQIGRASTNPSSQLGISASVEIIAEVQTDNYIDNTDREVSNTNGVADSTSYYYWVRHIYNTTGGERLNQKTAWLPLGLGTALPITQTELDNGVTLNDGGINFDNSPTGQPHIRAGITAINSGDPGFFLGYDGGAYKFQVGDPSGNNLKFDGTNLQLTGSEFKVTSSGSTAPSINGTTIAGKGSLLKADGDVLFGDAAGHHIFFDQSEGTITLGGNVITENIAAGTITTDKLAANSITADKIQANAISAREIDADSINANHIVAGEITADAIAANAITADKVTANSVVATLLTASAVTATEISATNLSSISANIGDITAGTLKGGNIPDANSAPAGSESGAFLNLTGGKMVFGNASKYVLFDGTNLELNGVVIDASSTVNATATPELIVKEDGTAEITDAASLNFTSGLNVAVSGTEATISLDTPTDNNFTSALLSKLNGIESGATADQTAAEIRVLVGSATDSNVFTDTLLSKLNGIANNANNYSLPTASPTVLGGIKIGNRVSIASGVLSADIQSDNNFTTTLKNKLDGIESGATGDQTAAEIRSLVESATDSNVFTDADHTKLNNIEAGATGDQTASEIRALVASASDSNVFTDADHSKLDGIESGATADQTAAEIRTLVESASDSNVFTDADHTKLNGIAAGANAYVLPTNNVTNASVSGSTLTLTREGASNVTFTDTNTQYSAGSGLGLSGTTFSVDSTVVRTTGTQTIGGAKTFTGDVTFNGTTTYINTTTLNVGDNIITLNADFTGSSPTESAGIEVERGTQTNKTFIWKESSDRWSFGSESVEAGTFFGSFIGSVTGSPSSLAGLSTDDLAEGSTNLYFTNTRARGALSGGTGISYNNTTGAIVNSAPDQTVSLTGSGATSVSGTYPNFTISSTDTNTVPNNATITISAGTELSTGGAFTTDQSFNETITINHANVSRTNNTSASSPGYGGTFTAIDSITTNARGHVTAVNTKTVTIPASDNTDTNTVTQIREDSGTYRTGNITLQSGSNVTISEPSAGVFNFAATDTNTTNFNIQASGGTSTNISAGETINFTGGGATSVSRSGNTITFTSTDTNTDTNNYVSSVSFSTSNGVLTLNRAGLGALTVDLDGRYSTTDTNYFLNGISKSGNTLTFSVSGATNQSYTFGSNAFTSTTIPTNNNQLTNGAGYTTNTGTVTSVAVSAGTGLSGGGTVTTSGTISLAVDLSELTDMTAAVDTSVDELILLDNGAERRKRFAEIFGSNAYNSTTIPTNNNQLTNGAGYTTNTGTVTSVSGGTGLSGTVTTSGSLNLTNTGVSAATYGSSTNIPQIAVDAQGRITSASNVAVSIPSGANNATITLSAGNGLTGGESFTTDQASNETITFNVGAGDGISVAANSVAVDSTVLRAGTGTLINDIINANVITADMIQANSIVATIITAEEITASHIATNTITANEIAAGAITASELQISNNSGGSAGIFMDYNSGNSRIDIRDSSALRVRIGYLA